MLDFQAARAVAQARVFERTVNDRGPWSIRIGDQEALAVRVRTHNSVRFIAHFDDGADPAIEMAWLVCAGEEISSRAVTPIAEAFVMEWKLSLADADPVLV